MSILQKLIETVAIVAPDHERDELMQAHRYLGQPISRLNGPDKVTGAARFSAEYPVRDLKHAALAFSTVSKGSIRGIATAAAEQAPGVLKVITHLNAPEMKVPHAISIGDPPSAGATEVKILNTERISWNGQPVALVVAETQEQAEHAASLIEVSYASEPGANSFEESIARAKKPKDVLGEDPEVSKGDADGAFASSAHRVDLTFNTPPHNHNAIEPHACIAIWDGDDKLTIYDTSQFTAGVAHSVAEIFGLKSDDVRVIAPYVGGGFGGKGSMWPYIQLCVLAARETGRPVRLALTREGVYRIVGGRTPSRQRVAIGADNAGKIRAFVHEGVTAQSTDNHFPEQFSFPPGICTRWKPTGLARRLPT